MKSLIVKATLLVILGLGLSQASNAAPYFCRPFVYAHPVYCGPRVIAERVACGPVFVPGHFTVNRFGARVWIAPHRVY